MNDLMKTKIFSLVLALLSTTLLYAQNTEIPGDEYVTVYDELGRKDVIKWRNCPIGYGNGRDIPFRSCEYKERTTFKAYWQHLEECHSDFLDERRKRSINSNEPAITSPNILRPPKIATPPTQWHFQPPMISNANELKRNIELPILDEVQSINDDDNKLQMPKKKPKYDPAKLKCPYCTKEYKHSGFLENHIKQKHPHTRVPSSESKVDL
jgi:hypothetical protein